MSKTKNLIKSALEKNNISTPLTDDVEILADELDRLKSIKNVWDSEGGKQLINELRSSAAAHINKLRELSLNPDLPKILGCIASYFAIIDLISTVRQVKSIDEVQEQLDDAVKKLRE